MPRHDPMMPAPDCRRWTPDRKLAVVTAVRAGDLTFAGACERWGLAPEELESWMRRAGRYGRAGLAVYRLQQVGR